MQLIEIKTDADKQVVSARELYEGLGIKVHFSTWMKRMREYGFIENIDFSILKSGNEHGGIAKIVDYIITVDMAKHISMMQRSAKGMKFRNYFIECERKLKEIPTVRDSYLIENPIARAKRWIEEQEDKQALVHSIEQQKQTIEEYKPKAEYYDEVLKSRSLLTTTQIAQNFGLSAKKLNELLSYMNVQFKQAGTWVLYSKYKDKGYTQAEPIVITHNTRCRETKFNTKWTMKGYKFLVEKLNEVGYYTVVQEQNMKQLSLY